MSRKIVDKIASDEEIRLRGFNCMKTALFTAPFNTKEIKKWLDETNYSAYNIREKDIGGGLAGASFKYGLTKDGVLENLPNFRKASIYESLAKADENLILQGEILVAQAEPWRGIDSWMLYATLDDKKFTSNRIAMQNPKWRIAIDLLSEKDPAIGGAEAGD